MCFIHNPNGVVARGVRVNTANTGRNPVGVGGVFPMIPKVALADSGNLGLEDTTPLGLQGNVPAWVLAGEREGGVVRR